MSNEDIYEEVQEDYTYDEYIDSLIPSDEILADDELFEKYCDLMADEERREIEQVLRDRSTYDELPF